MNFYEAWEQLTNITKRNQLKENLTSTDPKMQKVLSLLQPYKHKMLSKWGKGHGKKLSSLPTSFEAPSEKHGAMLIPNEGNVVFVGPTHMDMYFPGWEVIHTNLSLLDEIFEISKYDSDSYAKIKKAIENNLITYKDDRYDSVEAILSYYIYDSEAVPNDKKRELQDIFIYAPLYLMGVTYLRCEDTYLYWIELFGKMTEYQREQVQIFLDCTFYLPSFRERGLDLWMADSAKIMTPDKLTPENGYTVDDVLDILDKYSR